MQTCRLSPARSTGTNGIVKITAMSRQAGFAADTSMAVDLVGEYRVLMIMTVRVITE